MTQYGPEGDPITVPSTPPPPPAPSEQPEPIGLHNPAPLPGGASVEVDPVETAAPAAPEPEVPLTDAERLADAEATIAAQGAVIAAAKRMVSAWSDRADTALIKSDYQRGQRDATMACTGDLRNVLGL